MLNIAICDNDPVICTQLEENIMVFQDSTRRQFEVDVFYSGEELYKYIVNEKFYHLIFLGIEFDTINGIEIGRGIREERNDNVTQIVYVSVNERYAMRLFDIRPLNFLVKPLRNEKIEMVLKTAIMLIDNENPCFEFKTGRIYIRVPFNEIIYLESNKKKVKIFGIDGVYEFYGKLTDVIKRLPCQAFLQIHKSYIINYTYILSYQYENIEMSNKKVLPISQHNRKDVGNWIIGQKKEDHYDY
ncbi:LytR/AlgR family response regulator transcription factor [Lacrimispora algidixylanolytica]|uniref:Stage 0 sporulation protein A homolog n=1 Tax=Lacrimispora algidixylanolytica TaxID=94868 RepID=A0A419T303_9FIRM|nr:LytTR family DNA-binding domain-containing protein [Lacrimispora algidixylanolytica]RKD31819.1 hypothetical protein BET01_18785 [Lacrimispora algidixylanolytica]